MTHPSARPCIWQRVRLAASLAFPGTGQARHRLRPWRTGTPLRDREHRKFSRLFGLDQSLLAALAEVVLRRRFRSGSASSWEQRERLLDLRSRPGRYIRIARAVHNHFGADLHQIILVVLPPPFPGGLFRGGIAGNRARQNIQVGFLVDKATARVLNRSTLSTGGLCFSRNSASGSYTLDFHKSSSGMPRISPFLLLFRAMPSKYGCPSAVMIPPASGPARPAVSGRYCAPKPASPKARHTLRRTPVHPSRFFSWRPASPCGR